MINIKTEITEKSHSSEIHERYPNTWATENGIQTHYSSLKIQATDSNLFSINEMNEFNP